MYIVQGAREDYQAGPYLLFQPEGMIFGKFWIHEFWISPPGPLPHGTVARHNAGIILFKDMNWFYRKRGFL